MGIPIDETGKRYGKLTVIHRTRRDASTPRGRADAAWLCHCDCGGTRVATGPQLRSGQVNYSCGCDKNAHNVRHRMTNTPIYRRWHAMLTRCRNPATRDYQAYGGRGIVVCERWLTFENFLADMGDCPPGYSLDRIDPNGNYEPSNCRWADAVTQATNRRNSRERIRELIAEAKSSATDMTAAEVVRLLQKLEAAFCG